jgi:putative ABC transport system substrate-binding protein
MIELALRHRLPAFSTQKPLTRAGALASYSASFPEMGREIADYVDRILKGARPAELPVQQPSKFELVVNLKTAKALGLTVSPTLLARADDVIE